MAAPDRLLEDGPAEYWSAEKAPTPSQWKAIALAALKLADLPAPASRLDATVTLVRLRLADGTVEQITLPDPWETQRVRR